MDGKFDERLRIASDPLAPGERRIHSSQALARGLVAIQAEGLVDRLTGRNDGRPGTGDLLEIGSLRSGQLFGDLASGRRQVPYGLLEGVIQELIGSLADGAEGGEQ